MHFNKRSVVSLAVALGLGLAGQAMAETKVKLSNWVGPKHPTIIAGYNPAAENLKAAGFDVSEFVGGALLGAKPALPGIGDSIADMGMLAMTYFPAEFPHAQLVADMGLSTPNTLTAAMATLEYNLLNCAPCMDEYKTANTVYLSAYSTASYALISSTPIRSMDDLKGKKIRVPGSLWSRWAAKFEAVQVNVPSSEMFEGLDKGALDIAVQAPGALRSYALWDTAKFVTMLNLGTYHSTSLMTTNRDFWKDLTDDERKVILKEAARMAVDVSIQYVKTDGEVLSQLGDHGVERIEPTADMIAANDAFVAGDVDEIVNNAKEKYKIMDAAERVATYKGLIAKWAAIVEETGGERDALIARVQAEVYDNLPADHGMN